MLHETFHSASEDIDSPVVLRGAVSHHDHDHDHSHDHSHGHVHFEAVAPTEPSRAVVINVGAFTGALVLASCEERSGLEVQIHPLANPEARTHVWVLPREGRDGVVYAAIFPSLASGDYAVLSPDGAICAIVAVPANQGFLIRWIAAASIR